MARPDGSIVIDTKIDESGFNRGAARLKTLGASAGKAAAAGIGLAVIALGAYSVAAVGAAEADAIANKRIEAIATSMGLYGDQVDEVTDRLTDLATKTALATGVDDLAIKATQAKLLTFKQLAGSADEVGGAFDRATMAAIDLAAAGFGEAEQNAVQLGKALQDPVKGITALARSGVTFTEQEKEKIKTLVESGKVLEAQDLVLKAIETQVGGTADATASMSDRVGVAMGELQEAAGGPLMEAFDALGPGLMEGLKALEPVFGDIFGGIADIAEGGDSSRFVEGFTNLITMAADGLITALPSIIEAVVGIIVALAQALPGIIVAVMPALIAGFTSIVNALPEILPPMIEALGQLITMLADAIPPLIPVILDAVLEIVTAIADALSEDPEAFGESAAEIMLALTAGLGKALPGLLKAGWEIIVALAKAIGAYVATGFPVQGKRITDAIKTGLSNAWSALLTTARTKLKALTDVFSSIKDKFLSVGRNIADGIKEGLIAAWVGLKKKLSDLADKLPDGVKKVLRIKSPSRVFDREVGVQMALGIGGGFQRQIKSVYGDMARSVQGEMGRFSAAVVPSAVRNTSAAGAAPAGMVINFNQPVRTYSEVVMASRELGVSLARG